MANQEQLDRLRIQGARMWNQWRSRNPDVQIDLSDTTFSGAILSNANLSNVHLNDAISTSSIGHSWASPAKSMRVDVDGQEGLQLRPQILGDPKSCRGPVIRSSRTSALLSFLLFHLRSENRVAESSSQGALREDLSALTWLCTS